MAKTETYLASWHLTPCQLGYWRALQRQRRADNAIATWQALPFYRRWWEWLRP